MSRAGKETVEDIDNSIYETSPGTNILKVHLISMRTLCVRYSRKTGLSYFPFGFEGRIWDLIVSVPDYCLSFYFSRVDPLMS